MDSEPDVVVLASHGSAVDIHKYAGVSRTEGVSDINNIELATFTIPGELVNR